MRYIHNFKITTLFVFCGVLNVLVSRHVGKVGRHV